MSAAFKLSLPVDIPWERICVSRDMMDRKPCDLKFPAKWQSSMAVYKYVPDDDYQNYPGRKITYVKVTATITGYQPRDEEIQGSLDWGSLDTTTLTGVTELLESYFPCHGAILQVIVGPKDPEQTRLHDYPYILDFEPKKRELFEMATDTHERTSRSLESLNISNSAGTTRSLETMDIDMGGSTSFGMQGSYAGTGGGFDVSTSNAGQWGTRSINTDGSQTARTTDLGQEKRETFSHSTQLSQMYHLLDSYHLGTNRAVFFVQPRPHVLEEPSGFVRGPRPVEGIQEFFLVVSQPEDADDFCVSARLDTSHLVTTDILDYTYRTDISNLADAVGRIPNKNDEYIGNTTREACFLWECWDITYKCYRARDVDDQIYTAPTGFNIEGYNNLINESRHGSTSVQIAPGNKTLTVHAEAEGHICFEHKGVCVDCPDEIEKYSGYARRQVQVNLRSEERDRKIGEEEYLLLTTRGICCCPKDGPKWTDPRVTGTFAIPGRYNPRHVDPAKNRPGKFDDYAGSFHHMADQPASVAKDLAGARKGSMQTSDDDPAKSDCNCRDDAGKGDQQAASQGRMTIRQANGMLGFIKERMVKSIESADPRNQPKPYYQTDLFAKQLRSIMVRTRRSREMSGKPLKEVTKNRYFGEAIAKELEIKPDKVMVRDVFSYRNDELARMTGQATDDVVEFKLRLMGVPLTKKPGDGGGKADKKPSKKSR